MSICCDEAVVSVIIVFSPPLLELEEMESELVFVVIVVEWCVTEEKFIPPRGTGCKVCAGVIDVAVDAGKPPINEKRMRVKSNWQVMLIQYRRKSRSELFVELRTQFPSFRKCAVNSSHLNCRIGTNSLPLKNLVNRDWFLGAEPEARRMTKKVPTKIQTLSARHEGTRNAAFPSGDVRVTESQTFDISL
jgi:hypothetical protein